MTQFIDLSIPITNDVISDPEVMRPKVTYMTHQDTWQQIAMFFPGLEKDDLPDMPAPAVNRPGIGPLVDLLKVLLKQRSEETGVAPKLIANVSDLERIASDDAPDVAALKGWRHEIFGQYAEALKAGKLALASQDDAVVLVARD